MMKSGLLLYSGILSIILCTGLSASDLSTWSWDKQTIDSDKSDGRKFGLHVGDLTGDGKLDIVAGNYLYTNPGGEFGENSWEATQYSPNDLDAMALVDVDGDEYGDIVGVKSGDAFYWAEAQQTDGSEWGETKVYDGAPSSHSGGSQGYACGDIVPGGKKEIVVSDMGNTGNVEFLYIPDNPASENWTMVRIDNTNSIGVAVGDINGDGALDIAGGKGAVFWLENPGVDNVLNASSWEKHDLADVSTGELDRVEIADIDGDGKKDIIVAPECYNCMADIFWLKNGSWNKTVIGTHKFGGNLSVADIDHDGDIDAVVAEGQDKDGDGYDTYIYENDGSGNFNARLVGRSDYQPHLGCALGDFDNDGDFDIIHHSFLDNSYIFGYRSNCPDCMTSALNTRHISPRSNVTVSHCIKKGQLSITLRNLIAGNYSARLFSLRGRQIASLTVSHDDSRASAVFRVEYVPAGVMVLSLQNGAVHSRYRLDVTE